MTTVLPVISLQDHTITAIPASGISRVELKRSARRNAIAAGIKKPKVFVGGHAVAVNFYQIVKAMLAPRMPRNIDGPCVPFWVGPRRIVDHLVVSSKFNVD